MVISPLKSLMMNQAEMLEKKGLRCAILSDMRDKDKSGAYLHYQIHLKHVRNISNDVV